MTDTGDGYASTVVDELLKISGGTMAKRICDICDLTFDGEGHPAYDQFNILMCPTCHRTLPFGELQPFYQDQFEVARNSILHKARKLKQKQREADASSTATAALIAEASRLARQNSVEYRLTALDRRICELEARLEETK